MEGKGMSRGRFGAGLVVVALMAQVGVTTAAGSSAAGGLTVGSTDLVGRGHSPAISRDGRYVAFELGQVFVQDRSSGVTELVSVGLGGEQPDQFSAEPSISADGRYVAFTSLATNLVPEDFNFFEDVFVRDRVTGTTERISVSLGPEDTDELSDQPSISADGRYVAFTSLASTLIEGDENAVADIFVTDRLTGATTRVSVGPGGREADSASTFPAISPGGRYVAFTSQATNLVARDTNGVRDVFLRDLVTGTTRRVSVGPGGSQADGTSTEAAISAGGRAVAFSSQATDLVARDTNGEPDVFVRDRVTRVTRKVSVGPSTPDREASGGASISASGRYVAFDSSASKLVPDDTNGETDVLVRDRRNRTTVLASVGAAGQGDGDSVGAAISANGRHVAFSSVATNLVAPPTSGINVFVRTVP